MTFFDSDEDGLSDISESELFDALDEARDKCIARDKANEVKPTPPKTIKTAEKAPKIATKRPSFQISRDPTPSRDTPSRDSLSHVLPPPDTTWTSKYKPQNASQIAISPKKYQEIYSTLLEACTTAIGRVVIISGPAGSSKTTSLNQAIFDISENLLKSQKIIEWANPAFISGVPAPQAFYKAVSEFMYLRQDDLLRLVTIEDMPNIMHGDTRKWFRQAVEEYLNYDPAYKMVPLVFVISENENNESQSYAESYTVESIFARELLNHPKVRRVKVSTVAKSFMKKPLLEILLAEAGAKHVTVSSTKSISRKLTLAPKSVYSSCLEVAYVLGDIRSAINALEFFHRSALTNTTADYIRPDQVSFFRAMGRVFYGTKKDTSDIDHDVIGGLLTQWGDDLGARNNIVDYLFALGVKMGGNNDITFVQEVSETSSIGAVNTSGRLSSGDSIEFLLRMLHYLFQLRSGNRQFGSGNLFKEGIEARKKMLETAKEVEEKVHNNRWTNRESMVLFEDFYTTKIKGKVAKKEVEEEVQIFELTGKPFTSLASLGEKLDLEDDLDLMEAMSFDDDDWE